MSQTMTVHPRRSAGLATFETRNARYVAARSAGFSDTSGARRAGVVAMAGLVTAGIVAPSANAALEVPAGVSISAADLAQQPREAAADPIYTSVALNVRTGTSLESTRLTTLDQGTQVTVTGDTFGDWTEVRHNGIERWVATQYLSNEAPVAPAPEATTETKAESTESTTESETVAAERTAAVSRSTDRPAVTTSGLDAKRAAVVQAAYQGVGTGYVYGGTAFGAWDCSGFVLWATGQAGITGLPRPAAAQAAALTPTSNPQPGDLVLQNGGGHIGIYVGDGMMISALNSSSGTQLHPVSWMPVSGYYTYS